MSAQTRKTIVALLFFLFPLLYPYVAYGDFFHELVGTLVGCVVIAHLWANRRQFGFFLANKQLLRFQWRRVISMTCVLLFVLQIASGVELSKSLFQAIHFSLWLTQARFIHLVFGHWLLILVGFHAGNHYVFHFEKRLNSQARKFFASFLALFCVFWGTGAFVRLKIINYLVMRATFAFLDYDVSPARLTFDYYAVFFACCVLGCAMSLAIRKYERKTPSDSDS